MSPTLRAAGISGVLAGVGLAVEAVFWFASGWTPDTWSDPGTALAFLRDSGDLLRAGVFAGVLNLVFTTLLIAGLASRLRDTAPTAAAGTLYFGVIGVASHGLVPVALWLGVPLFAGFASADLAATEAGWTGFAVFLAAAGGLGSLFGGASVLATGWGGVATRALPRTLAWIAVLTGAASIVTVLTTATPLEFLGQALYAPMLVASIVFRTWAGIHLWRSPEPVAGPATQPVTTAVS